ncbi:hypothetical protein AB1L30_10480 [Bremerella sp. JC817]|uniref:hypothetical protein n=1 Tax=Bremerella sp. JC817 TaxID=3231756 RepID=UPI003457C543
MRYLVVFAALVTISAGSLLVFAEEPMPAAKMNAAEKILELQKERRATLKSALDYATQKFESGQGGFEEMLAAEEKLAVADLKLTPTAAARMEIHKRRIESLRKQEQSLDQGFKSGIRSLDTYLAAKAARLQAEIDMLRDTDDETKR